MNLLSAHLQAVRKLHQRSAGWGKKAEKCPLSGPKWEEMATGVQKYLRQWEETEVTFQFSDSLQEENLRDTLRLPAGSVLHFLPPRKGGKTSSTSMGEDKGEGEMLPKTPGSILLHLGDNWTIDRDY